MKLAQILSLQLTAFFATALVLVWFMTRPTSAAKRVLGMARLPPASAETRRAARKRLRSFSPPAIPSRAPCRAAQSEQHRCLCRGPPAGGLMPTC